MKKIFRRLFITAFCFGTSVFLFQLTAQSFIPFTALESDDEGTAAWYIGHNIPLGVCGLTFAYYKLASPDYQNIHPTSEGALHCKVGVSGFPNLMDSLTAYGYTIDQLTLKFDEMNLGNDIQGQDWFVADPVETRFYNNGNFVFLLDGEPLVGGFMPRYTIVIDYNVLSECDDDEISGHTEYAAVADSSGTSSPGVQQVAAGLLQDIGNYGIRFTFTSIQPAGQTTFNHEGHPGSFFEGQNGKIELGTVPLDETLPSTVISQATNPTPGECVTADQTVVSTGSGDWLHITHSGNLVTSILDSEPMGTITANFYVNTGALRSTTNDMEYMDRNFEINPTIQPSGTVRVRFYFTYDEWNDLIGGNDGDGNDLFTLTDLVVSKFSSAPCDDAANVSGGTLHEIIEYGAIGTSGYYADIEVTSFSAFYPHGGGAPLPVDLMNFKAEAANKNVNLSWQTATEINNKGFELQRSTTGIDFQTIGWIEGQGNTNIETNYNYLDKKVFSGQTYYYRLKQVDLDDQFEYSNIASATLSETNKSEVLLYPNAATDYINVEFGNTLPDLPVLEVRNFNGQLMNTSIISYSEAGAILDLLEIPSGMYLLIIKDQQGNVVSSPKFKKE